MFVVVVVVVVHCFSCSRSSLDSPDSFPARSVAVVARPRRSVFWLSDRGDDDV